MSIYPERVLKALQRAQLSLQIGDAHAASAELEKVVKKFPKGVDCWLLYGQALGQLGDHEGAERCLKKAVALQPRNADGWYNLGISYAVRTLYKQAAEAYRKALACLETPHPDVYGSLAGCYVELGEYAEAVALYEKLVAMRNTGETWSLLGIAYQGLVRYELARDAYLQAIAKGARNYTVDLNLGTCYSVLNDFEKAAEFAARALEHKPGDPVALHNLGSALFNAGRLEEAMEAYTTCTLPAASASLLLMLNYADPPCPARLRSEHEAAMAKSTAAIARRTLARERKPDDRLRVGFVSPDFREHPVAHFLEGMVAQIDRSRFEIFFYSDVRQNDTDAMTERFQAMGDNWRDTSEASDDTLDELVRRDGVHILIDLAGHTHTRLHAFARRLAPVQATYLGYSATTGLAEMDYLLADDVLVPDQASEDHYSERVIRLGPVVATYTPPDPCGSVQPLPMLKNGYPTFGSFAQLRKVGPTTIQLWADALKAVPEAKMLVMCKGLHIGSMQDRFLAPFAARGIDPSRFILRGSGSMSEYLQAHDSIDLILDATAWNGHTTTLHALWMGVPTLAIRGTHHTSRFGEMVLNAAGLAEFVAPNADDFAIRARAIVDDPEHLATLRSQMRSRLLSSPLCDHRAMARRFEAACLSMWQDELV